MRRLNFQDHRRELDDNRYVYAVLSRRSRGLSIGINLNPDKVCNFDCPYCQVDRSLPGGSRDVDLDRLDTELAHLFGLITSGKLWSVPPFDTAPAALRRVNDIALAGDGEPTACPVFAQALSRVGRQRAAFGLDAVEIQLLTNATLLHRPAVQAGLAELDRLGGRIVAKLDAGTEAWFQRVDGTTLPFSRVLKNLADAAKIRPITLQCMFPTLDGEGPTDAEIDAWQGRIADLLSQGGQIDLVQVYSVARKPADPRVGVLPLPRLEAIARRAQALGLAVQVAPGIEAGPTPAPGDPG
jgi:wyosine [tRNA(Phe)-imidazoG37] synthetase (radical SAM superfamily)